MHDIDMFLCCDRQGKWRTGQREALKHEEITYQSSKDTTIELCCLFDFGSFDLYNCIVDTFLFWSEQRCFDRDGVQNLWVRMPFLLLN